MGHAEEIEKRALFTLINIQPFVASPNPWGMYEKFHRERGLHELQALRTAKCRREPKPCLNGAPHYSSVDNEPWCHSLSGAADAPQPILLRSGAHGGSG